MFIVKDNKEIGAYFARLVDEKYQKPMRQFGKACLELQHEPTDKVALDRMANKLTQIKEGKKGIQLTDLPVYTHLLGVTCEELLSAGEYIVPSADFMTVRQFAASNTQSDWETFVNREDKPFLNCDEFGKNAIEYALEFKNYALLKYLMDQGYIWFVDLDPQKYTLNFGAGTRIKRRDPSQMDNLTYDLRDLSKDSDFLRRQMICLALEHKDFEMLTTLKAREIPTLYGLSAPGVNDAQLDTFWDDEMIRRIANADDSVIDYFSQEFSISERHHPDRSNAYMFPYIGSVAALLIEHEHPCAEAVLKRCAEHNRGFLQNLENTIANIVNQKAGMYETEWMKDRRPSDEELYRQSLNEIFFFRNDEIVTSWCSLTKDGGVTNLIEIECASKSFRFAPLIDDINESYNKVMEYEKVNRK